MKALRQVFKSNADSPLALEAEGTGARGAAPLAGGGPLARGMGILEWIGEPPGPRTTGGRGGPWDG